jgi:phage/plasmid primase-like uncharacterized protein
MADDISAVAERLGARLKRLGNEHVGPCPKCGGRDRFSVNTKKQVFNCRGCGVGGDAIELVRHVLDCNFTDALDFVGGERPRPAAAFSPLAEPNLKLPPCPALKRLSEPAPEPS